MKSKPAVRILSCKKAVKPINGVLWYGTALSRTRGTRVVHGLVARKTRTGGLAITCSCEGHLHHQYCAHVPAFIKRISRANKAAVLRRAA